MAVDCAVQPLERPISPITISTALATQATCAYISDGDEESEAGSEDTWEACNLDHLQNPEVPHSYASMNSETILSLLNRCSDADDSLKGLQGSTTTAVTICCKAKADEGSRKMAMLDVQIDAAIPVGSIVFSTFTAFILNVRPGHDVLCQCYPLEKRPIQQVLLSPYQESLYACGLNLENDYVKDNLKSGFLLHTDQIICLPSNKHDTMLIVQVEAIAFEVGKYAHWLSDAESVDLQSSEEESDKEG